MAKKTTRTGGIKKARKPTESEIKLARKNKYRTAKPSKAGVMATTASVNKYIDRYNKWADIIRARAKAQKAKEMDEAKGKAGKIQVSGL